jgi:hypothetical protein
MPYSPYYAGGFKDSPDNTTPITADFLNDLETALAAAFVTGEGAIPNPAGKASGEALVWDGDSWEAVQVGTTGIADASVTRAKLSGVFPILNADVDPAAAIARSKLNFGSGLVNADIAAAAAIAYSKLSLGNSIVNADIGGSAAIAYSKLNLAGLIQESDFVTNIFGGSNGQVLGKTAGDWSPVDGMQKIAVADISSGVSSVDFASIAGDFKHLLIVAHARGDTAATNTNLNVRFNGDTGGNYDVQRLSAGAGTVSPAEAFGAVSAGMAVIPANTAGANLVGGGLFLIPHYSAATHNKSILSLWGYKLGTSSGNLDIAIRSGHWRSSAAITQVTFLPGAGNIVSGSMFSLYGMG